MAPVFPLELCDSSVSPSIYLTPCFSLNYIPQVCTFLYCTKASLSILCLYIEQYDKMHIKLVPK